MSVEEKLKKMAENMNGYIPEVVKLAAEVFPEMLEEHSREGAFAMPAEGGALDEETRTLIYLGIALATNSKACIEAKINRAIALGIPKDKIIETFKIARFAEASRVFGNAEIIFRYLKEEDVK